MSVEHVLHPNMLTGNLTLTLLFVCLRFKYPHFCWPLLSQSSSRNILDLSALLPFFCLCLPHKPKSIQYDIFFLSKNPGRQCHVGKLEISFPFKTKKYRCRLSRYFVMNIVL
jgi:hypothetical protein